MQKQFNEDFIEEYSEQFAAVVCDKFFAANTHISGQEILSITPSKQVNFFVIKLLFNNWQDESARLESPFFDYTANDVKEAMVTFMNVLSRHIKVGRKEFEILLRDALRDTLFLIMSPNAFMEIEMDRKGTEALSQKSAKNIIKYLRVAKDEFSSNIMSQVGKDRDDLTLDESIISDEILNEEIGFLNEIVPLTLQMLEDGEDGEDSSPEETKVEDELPSIEPEDLPEPVKAVEPQVEEEPEAEQPEIQEEPTPEPAEEPEEEEKPEPEPSADIAPTEEPEEESTPEPEAIIEEEDEDDEEDQKPTPPRPATRPEVITNLDPDEEDEDDEDAILNSKFEDPMFGSSIAEKHEAESDSMLSAISLNHRYMFINELFDGEADLFAEAIEKVDNSNSFDQSVEILVQNYAKDFHWDMNSDEVKELLKIIFRRFR